LFTIFSYGNLEIRLSNESPATVYFDSLNLEHERLVWQENSYYPFGLTIKPLDQEGFPDHRFTYNGGSEFEKMTKWYETPFRIGYDA